MHRRIGLEELEARRLLASDWQNGYRPRDVSNDQLITSIDALIGINRLNSQASPDLADRPADSIEPFFDVNGDGFHSPIDVLLVVDSLNGGLRLTTDLVTDSGAGPQADQDRLTNDVAIRGTSQIQVDYLELQINQQGPWHNIVSLQKSDGSFAISEAVLEQLIGARLQDGSLTVDVRAGHTTDSSPPDRTSLQLKRDSVNPSIPIAGPILMTRPGELVVPLSEQIPVGLFNPAQLKLYDVTWGQNATTTAFGLDGNYPRFPVLPQSVRLAANGREIIIALPTSDRSIKYSIEYGGLLEDGAGNRSVLPPVVANYFAPTAIPLEPAQLVNTELTLDARILEYRIDLAENEVLVWPGNQS